MRYNSESLLQYTNQWFIAEMHKINLYMTLSFILGKRNYRRKIVEIMSFHVLLERLLNARSRVVFSHAFWGLESHCQSTNTFFTLAPRLWSPPWLWGAIMILGFLWDATGGEGGLPEQQSEYYLPTFFANEDSHRTIKLYRVLITNQAY